MMKEKTDRKIAFSIPIIPISFLQLQYIWKYWTNADFSGYLNDFLKVEVLRKPHQCYKSSAFCYFLLCYFLYFLNWVSCGTIANLLIIIYIFTVSLWWSSFFFCQLSQFPVNSIFLLKIFWIHCIKDYLLLSSRRTSTFSSLTWYPLLYIYSQIK